MRLGALALGMLAVMGLARPSAAQDYPSRPISIVLPLAAGSGLDVIARLYGDRLQQALGKPVVIENRPGAAMLIATQAVASAPPDGYSLLVATSSAIAINPVLFKQINYDPVKGFAPISLYVKSPFILVVNPDLPVKNVAELIALAKQRKDLNYSSPGVGVVPHLAMEYVKGRFGLDMAHVPYRSTPQSILDIASGQVQLGFVEVGASLPLIQDGKLRVLAVSSATRLPILPDAPTFAEAANAPDFEAVSWHALLAPAHTPKPVLDRLHKEMKTIMNDPEIKTKVANLGLIPVDTPSPEGIESYFGGEREKWGALVRKLGLEGSQ